MTNGNATGIMEKPHIKVYEDYEEYVDLDEHERARAYAHDKNTREARERERHEDFLDEYHYGEDSGEAFEQEDDAPV